MDPPENQERASLIVWALRLCHGHEPLALWLLGTLLYGAVAGVLLHERPHVAGAVLATIWVAAIWRAARRHP